MSVRTPAPARATAARTPGPRALKGVRVLSLALNLPGPAALQRCREMGARCVKLEPPGPDGQGADPMPRYNPAAYEALQQGIRVRVADLKSERGQALLHRELARTDVLLTSFRPSALHKLGLAWKPLHARYPALSQVAIVGAAGARAEEPGHDLTYLAEQGLVDGLALPTSLFADMGGSLMATEAVLQAVLLQRADGRGRRVEVALGDAAAWLALPRRWGLTQPGALLGGAHAGYRMYACRDGRVALAALEPHFARALCAVAGIAFESMQTLLQPATQDALTTFLAGQTRRSLDKLAAERDLPLHTLPA